MADRNGVSTRPDYRIIDGMEEPTDCEQAKDVVVRMAVPKRPMLHCVDDGEEVELYVTFAEGVLGIPYKNRTGDGRDDDEFAYQVLRY